MLSYATRRLVLSIPTLLFISFVIFMLLQFDSNLDPFVDCKLNVKILTIETVQFVPILVSQN